MECRIVTFSDEAKDLWLDISNDIESKMAPGQIYDNARDHASKLAEIIARTAANIHYFEHSFDSKISVESLRIAIDLVSFYSFHFLNNFCPLPMEVVLGEKLYFWLVSYRNRGFRYIKKNKILQYGPPALRKSKNLNDALNNVLSQRLIAVYDYNTIVVIDLYPGAPYDDVVFKRDMSLFNINQSSPLSL
ncbi:cp4-57 prophage protein [Shewanella decolorationis S12]|uniref:Cp4-57 prophage protein n=1 Tax=Shewanella decolorationis S12 TaxID=1353536 RepID=A0ABN0PJX5_9GAMM|nr:cp4-57 prophage protein [Shewanella decolorationis S12]GLR34509.1 hypothetical protein GCM10007922_40680 [Shewanella decolorationis]